MADLNLSPPVTLVIVIDIKGAVLEALSTAIIDALSNHDHNIYQKYTHLPLPLPLPLTLFRRVVGDETDLRDAGQSPYGSCRCS